MATRQNVWLRTTPRDCTSRGGWVGGNGRRGSPGSCTIAGSNPAPSITLEPVGKLIGGTMASKKAKKGAPKKRGPRPETLKLEGDWKAAITKALKGPRSRNK